MLKINLGVDGYGFVVLPCPKLIFTTTETANGLGCIVKISTNLQRSLYSWDNACQI